MEIKKVTVKSPNFFSEAANYAQLTEKGYRIVGIEHHSEICKGKDCEKPENQVDIFVEVGEKEDKVLELSSDYKMTLDGQVVKSTTFDAWISHSFKIMKGLTDSGYKILHSIRKSDTEDKVTVFYDDTWVGQRKSIDWNEEHEVWEYSKKKQSKTEWSLVDAKVVKGLWDAEMVFPGTFEGVNGLFNVPLFDTDVDSDGINFNKCSFQVNFTPTGEDESIPVKEWKLRGYLTNLKELKSSMAHLFMMEEHRLTEEWYEEDGGSYDPFNLGLGDEADANHRAWLNDKINSNR